MSSTRSRGHTRCNSSGGVVDSQTGRGRAKISAGLNNCECEAPAEMWKSRDGEGIRKSACAGRVMHHGVRELGGS